MPSMKSLKAFGASVALAVSAFALTATAHASDSPGGPQCVPLGPLYQECTLIIPDPNGDGVIVLTWIEEINNENQP